MAARCAICFLLSLHDAHAVSQVAHLRRVGVSLRNVAINNRHFGARAETPAMMAGMWSNVVIGLGAASTVVVPSVAAALPKFEEKWESMMESFVDASSKAFSPTSSGFAAIIEGIIQIVTLVPIIIVGAVATMPIAMAEAVLEDSLPVALLLTAGQVAGFKYLTWWPKAMSVAGAASVLLLGGYALYSFVFNRKEKD
uniref:Uncharacterized protein n=1 Tax=Haptolina brevifila TaxID=156173 RepID=A0A7S2GWX8_9EUKA|mmetsp:Transcript_48520/g.96687  ORF Transcript_48520/g.96687 Transcript_48520/m.96687 type:complete len:197 (+) Transcript_48520:146-736(+)|eukprot:CAMPEP_0174722538 /NCGR_PEP_ID=MMETSP1094-20130205/38726_1 /TAXON_ID=156173 /ORGANISM="Chrysochromulina brevifilum, Strain UTEX LB 985" /LENGTH=196 /DNA_ID=CAMNT_0015923417 /DNA_START=142 /DNA_END=732 /DNA_ORIENTATION=-